MGRARSSVRVTLPRPYGDSAVDSVLGPDPSGRQFESASPYLNDALVQRQDAWLSIRRSRVRVSYASPRRRQANSDVFSPCLYHGENTNLRAMEATRPDQGTVPKTVMTRVRPGGSSPPLPQRTEINIAWVAQPGSSATLKTWRPPVRSRPQAPGLRLSRR
jgi:hypothetical protein